jgi:hypothetical protein
MGTIMGWVAHGSWLTARMIPWFSFWWIRGKSTLVIGSPLLIVAISLFSFTVFYFYESF